MPKKWTKNEEKFLKNKIDHGEHPKDFIDELNEKLGNDRTYSSVEHKITRMGLTLDGITPKNHLLTAPQKVVEEHVLAERKIEELKAKLSIAERKYRVANKNANLQENLIGVAKQHIKAFPAAPQPKIIIPKGDITHETVLLLLSDFHLGENVDGTEVNGINEYNVDIFRYRMKFLEQHIIDIIKNKLIGYSFDKLVIAGLGDWVSGLIHQELIDSADGNIMEWTLGGSLVVAQFIRNLAQVFPKIEFVGVVGNHGRLHKKPRFKQRYINWDYFMYQIISLLLANQKNITFEIPKSFWTLKEINGHPFLLFHGDNINSYASIPWYGIERTIAKFKELLEAKDQKFDYICMGHFHNRSILDRVKGELILNGSVIGGNEYSIGKLFTSSQASQHLCGVHRRYGTSWNYKVKIQYAPTKGDVPYEYVIDNAIGDFVKDGF